ncbi:immunoglobulin mu Fc receptor isoform X4 [Symphalangus syndactylus]|uniref:immunoglobulin mu Fc receptor isoform X4 n=1 Tax=Symphalangus syndactylus TaxID=9590 RepID=UPI002441A43F|nr:fas apoptotic inhibitory molecule 3 isoform X3 [Symphalangus syndactylus]
MDFWLWPLYFLPISGALRILPEVKVEGELGGSVTIKCPLPEMHMRIYLCRMAGSGTCGTVVSTTNFIKAEYKGRVTLKQCPHKNLFLVEVTQLTESDSGVYACGAGMNTDRGKTKKVTLNVHSEYEPSWEEQPMSKTPKWFHLPYLFQMPAYTSSSKFVTRVTTPAQRTKVPPVHHSSPTTQITHRPRVSRASSVAGDKPPTFLPSTTASKISALEGLIKPQTPSYNHHTRLHRQRRARRLAVRMRALESPQRPHGSPRPRSRNNIYSACPRRARGADAAGKGEAPVPGLGAPLPPAPLQVSESPWLHAPSLKTSCEYVSLYHQPATKMEDSDSDDYINVPA